MASKALILPSKGASLELQTRVIPTPGPNPGRGQEPRNRNQPTGWRLAILWFHRKILPMRPWLRRLWHCSLHRLSCH